MPIVIGIPEFLIFWLLKSTKMNITFNQLRDIKHSLPTGSVARIASKLKIKEQTVRNYFGASDYKDGGIAGKHWQPGPNGGIVQLENDTILNAAREILAENNRLN